MFGSLRAFGGWLAAYGAAAVVIVGLRPIFMLIPLSSQFGVKAVPFLLAPVLLFFIIICVITALPAMFVILMSVALRIRSVIFFGTAGAAVGALSISVLAQSIAIWTSSVGRLFALAGLVAGVTYWFVAGRHALCQRAA